MTPSENWSRTKELLAAHARQGAHEIGAALYPSGTAAQHPELGMPFTRPPGLVTEGLRPGLDAGHSRRDVEAAPRSVPEPGAQPAAPEAARDIEPPEPDIERD